ncbi:MAG: response regulator [Verrucomicrobia bacterium]|nr:response regulator [Verrucomicrobiota bacterium]MBU4291096.1 response regulator [Verrucomicrobiota bacterium]MBU4429354.1 response regulator [Verrucomicrobiota bacterium]MBU4498133.1 response regulator [Verrucomicrobiota bacterium]MCG2680113.1 response regulator [Kiritimatiellia bacterium]
MKSKRINILLVEDNPDEVVLIKEQLLHTKDTNFNIASVGRLDAALSWLAESQAEVVMLDLILPDSRGLETFRKVYGRFPEIPIIVLTCVGDEALASQLVKEGAQDYLIKGQGDIGALVHALRYAIERHSAKKNSQEALKRLRELNETKSQFVAEVSHEIRTPLAIIREFVSLVRDETVGPLNEKQCKCLDAALRNCDKLTDLISRILDLARIEAGKAELHRTKADLTSLLMQFRNDFTPVCQTKKQTLVLDVPDNLPMAHCDVTSVHNILTNLIGNAHKFTPEKGTLRIRTKEEGRFLRIDVEDTGPGIPRDSLEKIFEAFVQIDRKDGPGTKGTGLGLKIAKSLVELNGGCISVDSTIGKGSCFSFTLPVYDKELPSRILIVDDEELVVRMIEKVLRYSDLKLEVKSTLSGLDSLIIAGEFKPNLIILDMHLAEVGGEQVLLSLRQQSRQHNSKVLIISGDVHSLTEVVRDGADEVLAKPFTPNDLLDKIRILLNLEPKTYLEPIEEKGR